MVPEPIKISDFFASVFSSLSQVFLVPMPPVNVGFIEGIFRLTRSLGIMDRDYIISAKFSERKNIFAFFKAFESIVWVNILICLLMLGFLYSCITGSAKDIFNNIWYLSFPLFSEPFAKIPKRSLLRAILIVWILSAFILLTGFSGAMLKLMIQQAPFKQIDSWNDLYKSKDTKVLVFRLSSAHQYIVDKDENDDMAGDFFKRLEDNMTFEDARSVSFLRQMLQRISTGCCALITEEKQVMKYAIDKAGYDISNLHLSEEGFGIEPYFMTFNKMTADDIMFNTANKLLVQINLKDLSVL